jgi:hypothetical protein
LSRERDALTVSQRIDVGTLIRANMRRVGTTVDSNLRGYWEYINGYSDERISVEIGCNIKGVAHIRREDRGNYPPAAVKQHEVRLDEADGLKKRVADLEAWAALVANQYNCLLVVLGKYLVNFDGKSAVLPEAPKPPTPPTTLFPEAA